MRAQALEEILHQAADGADLLERVRLQVALGHGSYWTFMIAWALLLIGAVGVTTRAPTNLKAVAEVAGTVLKSVVRADLETSWRTLYALVMSPWRITRELALGLFLAAWYLSHKADGDMADVFSSFWHRRQTEMRQALKQARTQAQALGSRGDR